MLPVESRVSDMETIFTFVSGFFCKEIGSEAPANPFTGVAHSS